MASVLCGCRACYCVCLACLLSQPMSGEHVGIQQLRPGVCVQARDSCACTDTGQCKTCCGSQFCEHKRLCLQCRICQPELKAQKVSLCPHNKRKARCRECGGSQFCEVLLRPSLPPPPCLPPRFLPKCLARALSRTVRLHSVSTAPLLSPHSSLSLSGLTALGSRKCLP